MSFYGLEPVDRATALYVRDASGGPGSFLVTVAGQAPRFTTGVTLARDPTVAEGLAIDVMGWTGPRGEGTVPYLVRASFVGEYQPTIVIVGSNRRITIPVEEAPDDSGNTGAAP